MIAIETRLSHYLTLRNTNQKFFEPRDLASPHLFLVAVVDANAAGLHQQVLHRFAGLVPSEAIHCRLQIRHEICVAA
jgi:hypothetical protein